MPVVWRRVCRAVWGIVLCSTPAIAQDAIDTTGAPPPPGVSAALDSARALRGQALTVSLYTYGPSDVFFERFGHAAIGVQDRVSEQDVAFNWGIFDFNQPRFLWRFLTGDTRYQMAGFPTLWFNSVYRADNRTVRQQELTLTPVERAALLEFLQWNAQDAHKYYRYDYYRDNCSTRVRDALDRVLRGRWRQALRTVTPSVPARTWRGETVRLLDGMSPMVFGSDLALGRHADEPLSAWDEEFLPDHLADHLTAAALPEEAGARRLVARDSVWYVASRTPLPQHAPTRSGNALVIGAVVAGLLVFAGRRQLPALRRTMAVALGLWGLMGGLAGLALLLAGTVTRHAPYMGANTTLLLLQPLLLVAAVVLPVAWWRGQAGRAARGVSAILALCALAALVAELIPGLRQESRAVLFLIAPVHVALGWSTWRLRAVSRHTNSNGQRA